MTTKRMTAKDYLNKVKKILPADMPARLITHNFKGTVCLFPKRTQTARNRKLGKLKSLSKL